MVLCGRGSSGHAGVHLRYLIETSLGLVVSASAPSIVTSYRKAPNVAGALFVVISQSGRSPDLVAATRAAREGGALTLALVNAPDSPVAQAAELVLPIAAGPERAVAATKTVVNSLVAGAQLVARWAEDAELEAAIRRLPDRLAAARDLDWSAWTADLAAAPASFVTGRGLGLGPIREIALKISETLRLPALAYSAAELRHGPRAAVLPATPVLALRQGDEVGAGIDALVEELRAARHPGPCLRRRGRHPAVAPGRPSRLRHDRHAGPGLSGDRARGAPPRLRPRRAAEPHQDHRDPVSAERTLPADAVPDGRPPLGLGVDAGGTATRWRLAAGGGAPVAGGAVEPLSGHIYSPEAEARARAIVAALAEAATAHGRPAAIVAGVTGLAPDAPAVALLRGLFAAGLRAPRGAHPGRRGHVDRLPRPFRAGRGLPRL